MKVRNQVEASTIRSLASNRGLASHLGDAWALMGDWRYAFEERKRIQAVAADEVIGVAQRYLISRQRTVAWLVRGTAAPARPGAGRPGTGLQPWESN